VISRIFGIVDRSVSWAEIVWKAITFIVVAFGGTTTAIIANTSEVFKNYSLFISLLIGIATSIVLVILFYFINLSRKQSAQVEYFNKLSLHNSEINPLSESFLNKVINLSDLQLPLNQPHKQKLFKNCKIVGPGAIFIDGGTYVSTNFHNSGHTLLVPESTNLTGVITLTNCTLSDCQLINVTIIAINNQASLSNFVRMGAEVVIGQMHSRRP